MVHENADRVRLPVQQGGPVPERDIEPLWPPDAVRPDVDPVTSTPDRHWAPPEVPATAVPAPVSGGPVPRPESRPANGDAATVDDPTIWAPDGHPGWPPVQASTATPLGPAPPDGAPVSAAPGDDAPGEAAPVEAAPVDDAPPDAAPVEAAPVEAAPVGRALGGADGAPISGGDQGPDVLAAADGGPANPASPGMATDDNHVDTPRPTGGSRPQADSPWAHPPQRTHGTPVESVPPPVPRQQPAGSGGVPGWYPLPRPRRAATRPSTPRPNPTTSRRRPAKVRQRTTLRRRRPRRWGRWTPGRRPAVSGRLPARPGPTCRPAHRAGHTRATVVPPSHRPATRLRPVVRLRPAGHRCRPRRRPAGRRAAVGPRPPRPSRRHRERRASSGMRGSLGPASRTRPPASPARPRSTRPPPESRRRPLRPGCRQHPRATPNRSGPTARRRPPRTSPGDDRLGPPTRWRPWAYGPC
ncbi:hypothetical protein JD81_05493 [Micromonospora sagamiensis]|uniref:Uncharacterized protein n=1 Tax=Micromonospora sagamiensis TaxID=47875 RepID=A0A562WQ45_9ACTN|nr:hypothetical protein JD81_05493 [Micromonospora sagamiensis]